MRYRVDDYKIVVDGGYVDIYLADPEGVTKTAYWTSKQIPEAIRLIVDETAKEVFCSSMQKDNIEFVAVSDAYTGYDFYIEFAIPSGKTIAATDQFTIEMDWGDALGDCAAVLDYIESGGLPTITAIAKQGSNANADISTIQFNLDTLTRNASTDLATIKGAVQVEGVATTIGMLRDNTNGLAAIKTSAASASSYASLANATALNIAGSIGTPGSGQGADLFAAIADVYSLIGYTISEIDNV